VEHIGSVVTQAPHSDGYQWSKYGQKWISKAKHSRYVTTNKTHSCTSYINFYTKNLGIELAFSVVNLKLHPHISNSRVVYG
jgi:hypothetical protein